MEVTFDNQSNVLSAQILAVHDGSVIYRIVTDEGLWSRDHTYLKDANPAVGEPTNVGVIHWKEKTFEIYGHKKKLSDIRRRPRNLLKKERFWRWAPDRKEYTVIYHNEKEWQVSTTSNNPEFARNADRFMEALLDGEVVASFSVPYRPKLFGKLKPMVVNLETVALEKDEVFLFLVLIYSECKRQDKMNASGGWQG
ncbi:hypothetical protein EST38_g7062 [Candolleomyces aberdarensis]|uniref:Uncharacterized protein n=1 Tax=Candolleomyces aberdarensis TaxID=2316362 RepID=A0A4Q2DG88_9AGAR|nr:hypothetical protein EST38_g7062 [Candolleomyces aberdarensis]